MKLFVFLILCSIALVMCQERNGSNESSYMTVNFIYDEEENPQENPLGRDPATGHKEDNAESKHPFTNLTFHRTLLSSYPTLVFRRTDVAITRRPTPTLAMGESTWKVCDETGYDEDFDTMDAFEWHLPNAPNIFRHKCTKHDFRYAKNKHPKITCRGDICDPELLVDEFVCYQSFWHEWRCLGGLTKAATDAEIVFGPIYMICERYYSHEDPGVTEGSCRIEYSLIFSRSDFCYSTKDVDCVSTTTREESPFHGIQCYNCQHPLERDLYSVYKQSDMRGWNDDVLLRVTQ
jgi:hypothetical protein